MNKYNTLIVYLKNITRLNEILYLISVLLSAHSYNVVLVTDYHMSPVLKYLRGGSAQVRLCPTA